MERFRRNRSIPLAVSGAMVLSLAGCGTSSDEVFSKENVGTVIGGIVGAAIGSQIGGGTGRVIAGVAGGLIGALVGREIGKSLSRSDRAAAERAQQQAHAAPVGQTVSWSNPETGHGGTVTPVAEVRNTSGQRCRDYRGTITVDGKSEQASGFACQQADGTWKFQDS